MSQPNRIEIKGEAKKRLKGNVWTILKPFAFIFAMSFVVSFFIESFFTVKIVGADGLTMSYTTLPGTILNLVYSIISILLSFGSTRYVLRFIRGEKFDIKEDLLYYFKNNAVFCVCLSLVVGIITTLWSLLFIIPGMVVAISYSMVIPLVVDGSKGIKDTMSKSKKMMYGHKMDYFMFVLSFFGWLLLSALTFGILLIWVSPYISVSEMLYYEELKKLSN